MEFMHYENNVLVNTNRANVMSGSHFALLLPTRNTSYLQRIIEKFGGDIKSCTTQGRTILEIACDNEKTMRDFFMWLIKQGADPHQRTSGGANIVDHIYQNSIDCNNNLLLEKLIVKHNCRTIIQEYLPLLPTMVATVLGYAGCRKR